MPQTTRALACLAALLAAASARGMFMFPEPAPVDRIIANASAYVEEHPKDASGHYTLGRAHYLAFHMKSEHIPAFRHPGENEDLPNLPPDWMVNRKQFLWRGREAEARRQVLAERGLTEEDDIEDESFWNDVRQRTEKLTRENWAPPAIDEEVADEHARLAVRYHRQAIELDPKNALYHIGLASILEQYAERADALGLGTHGVRVAGLGGQPLKHRWLAESLAEYKAAYDLALPEDRKHQHRPVEGLEGLVSYNAIAGYRRVAKALGEDGGDSGGDKDVLAQMAEQKTRFDSLQMRIVTPIIFAMEPVAGLDDLLAPGTIVTFDLDGDGVAERRPWVGPDTAILVWDPMRTGRVTSGRQLFGNATWWLLMPDGYRAMDLLDDDRDGALAGAELRGMALWFDRDGDAVSDPGEVTPIEDTAVAGLAVEALSQDGDAPMHPHGLRLRDGRALPTWDWMAPLAE